MRTGSMRFVSVHMPFPLIEKLRELVRMGYVGNLSEAVRFTVGVGLRVFGQNPEVLEEISYKGVKAWLAKLHPAQLRRVHRVVHKLLGIKSSVVVKTGNGLREYSGDYICPRCGTPMQLSGRLWWGEEWECPACGGIFTWTKTENRTENSENDKREDDNEESEKIPEPNSWELETMELERIEAEF